jgi:hypothetical protein
MFADNSPIDELVASIAAGSLPASTAADLAAALLDYAASKQHRAAERMLKAGENEIDDSRLITDMLERFASSELKLLRHAALEVGDAHATGHVSADSIHRRILRKFWSAPDIYLPAFADRLERDGEKQLRRKCIYV